MFKKALNQIPKVMLLLTAAMGFFSGCDNVGVKGLSDGSLAFSGVLRADWRSDGKYVLVWSPGSQDVQYLVYMQDEVCRKVVDCLKNRRDVTF